MAFGAKRKKGYVQRDDRIKADPDDRNYVGFDTGRGSLEAAQFRDISKSGMRILSRNPSKSQVGDVVEVEFSLPGSETELRSRALVTRRTNDFEFAVAFMDFASGRKLAFEKALGDYIRHLRATPFAKALVGYKEWMEIHRRGLLIALFGLLVFASAFTWIYLSSDEFNGREMKAWGAKYPRKYDWDYYNKIPKN